MRTDLSERQLMAVALLADESVFALQYDALLRRYEDLAGTDQLTALPNRRSWDERLTAHARRTHTPFVVAVADVGHFKAYNDSHNHGEADVFLQEVAHAIRSHVRTVDIVARWDGEEFAIALPGCQNADAQVVLDRVRPAMPREQTISIGYCQWEPGTSLGSLMKRADSAMYKVKRTGLDRVVSAVNLPAAEPDEASQISGCSDTGIQVSPSGGSRALTAIDTEAGCPSAALISWLVARVEGGC